MLELRACLQKGGRGELLPRAHFVHTVPILLREVREAASRASPKRIGIVCTKREIYYNSPRRHPASGKCQWVFCCSAEIMLSTTDYNGAVSHFGEEIPVPADTTACYALDHRSCHHRLRITIGVGGKQQSHAAPWHAAAGQRRRRRRQALPAPFGPARGHPRGTLWRVQQGAEAPALVSLLHT